MKKPAASSSCALLKAGIGHEGTVLLDVVSPCVTFNNHEGSTKSYRFAKAHEELLHEIDYIPFFEQITVDYEEGQVVDVEMHDGSHVHLRKAGLLTSSVSFFTELIFFSSCAIIAATAFL